MCARGRSQPSASWIAAPRAFAFTASAFLGVVAVPSMRVFVTIARNVERPTPVAYWPVPTRPLPPLPPKHSVAS
jgi:hypothetical protein